MAPNDQREVRGGSSEESQLVNLGGQDGIGISSGNS